MNFGVYFRPTELLVPLVYSRYVNHLFSLKLMLALPLNARLVTLNMPLWFWLRVRRRAHPPLSAVKGDNQQRSSSGRFSQNAAGGTSALLAKEHPFMRPLNQNKAELTSRDTPSASTPGERDSEGTRSQSPS